MAPVTTEPKWYEKTQGRNAFTQLKYLGGAWATFVAGGALYQWRRRDIPQNLKVIHVRMIAQAGVLVAVCGYGAFQTYQQFMQPPVQKEQEAAQ